MRVLVTGATGMLGAETARRLEDAGHAVRAFQRNTAGERRDEVLGDIADPTAVERAVAGMDAVVHLAARVGATGPWDEYERANVLGTRMLVDAARKAGVSRIVHVSSPSVAHAGESLIGAGAGPADARRARGHYARSKAMAEQIALGVNGGGLAVVAIRPHLVWGPGDTQLVGRIVERARAGRLAIVGTGTALIDSTYVTNAADALVAALDRCDRAAGSALVVTNGQPRPIAELMGRIVLAAGLEPPTRHVPAAVATAGGRILDRIWARTDRTDEPPMTEFVAEQMSTAHWFDQRETRRLLGWEPSVDLDEGFRRLHQWFARRAATPHRFGD